MARAGINKVQVQRARDAVLARGENPSLDTIRIELGNTGSKSTIHRYLKEIEEAESTRFDDEQLLSKTLGEMVGRLAARLKEEAGEIVSEAEKRHREREAQWEKEREGLQGALKESTEKVESLDQRLAESQASLGATSAELQSERLKSQRLTQQVEDLKVRLADKDAHLKSLEDKHQHARDALKHYRQASKEQRDQDIRRHEQQVQQLQAELRQANQSIIVKQGELTQFNKDNARLASELGAARKHVGSQEDVLRRSEQQLTALREQLSETNAQLSSKSHERDLLQEQLVRTQQELKENTHRQRELEISLAEVRTSLGHFKAIAEVKGATIVKEVLKL
ncbi:DNA-binding protein [Microbulbifer rhizosphaerae]|uniref:Chromosome segregation ATPase n=1 Tax=Microbulbifer rhizosphaerae TaxID=1562603 RepID=A0A7W4W9C8_9GAMM|nr:DNA-binding protein [Microbulbifer rhizosphaerae]MBB3060078.1 chromosome segregation ATPase [Microbulbifer rhizosphaerae]